ncbi:MAG: hypothetical protein N2037_01580, partial [Acidimicrobiales bacterium]|nr:hypothetical protein [Acidimicrobiales bacterium]
WMPFRGLLTALGAPTELVPNDAIPGRGPAVLDSPVGRLGVVISWEVFFTERAADAIGNGGEVLLNPTNGSSYWLTQVQSQQVASSRLRAIETGRWEVQAAPTGFSTIINPVGRVIDCTKINGQGATSGWCRSGVSEQIVLQAVIQRRHGRTLALTIGQWPSLVVAVLAVAGGWVIQRRQPPTFDS